MSPKPGMLSTLHMSHVRFRSDSRQQSAHNRMFFVESRSFFSSNSLQSASVFPSLTALLYALISAGRNLSASSASSSNQNSEGLRPFSSLFLELRKSTNWPKPSDPCMDSVRLDTRSVSVSESAALSLPLTGTARPSGPMSNRRFRTFDRSNYLHSMKNRLSPAISWTMTSE